MSMMLLLVFYLAVFHVLAEDQSLGKMSATSKDNENDHSKNNNPGAVTQIYPHAHRTWVLSRYQNGAQSFSRDLLGLQRSGLASRFKGKTELDLGSGLSQRFKGTYEDVEQKYKGFTQDKENSAGLASGMNKIESTRNGATLPDFLENMRNKEKQNTRQSTLAKILYYQQHRHSSLPFARCINCIQDSAKISLPSFEPGQGLNSPGNELDLKDDGSSENNDSAQLTGHSNIQSDVSLDHQKEKEFLFMGSVPTLHGNNEDDALDVTKRFRRLGDKHEKMMMMAYLDYQDRLAKLKLVLQLLLDHHHRLKSEGSVKRMVSGKSSKFS